MVEQDADTQGAVRVARLRSGSRQLDRAEEVKAWQCGSVNRRYQLTCVSRCIETSGLDARIAAGCDKFERFRALLANNARGARVPPALLVISSEVEGSLILPSVAR